MARPTAFKEEMVQIATDYINGDYHRKYGHLIPSHIGLAMILGVSKSSLYKWAENDSHPFSDILEHCNEVQQFRLLQGGLGNEFNSNICKLALGKHGYHDKTDTDLTSGGKPVNEWHFHPVTTDTGNG